MAEFHNKFLRGSLEHPGSSEHEQSQEFLALQREDGRSRRGLQEVIPLSGDDDGGSKLKWEAEPSELHLLQAQVPQKRSRTLAGKDSASERKRKTTEKLKKMSVIERCLLVERAIYAEDDLSEMPVEYQDVGVSGG